MSKRRLQEDDIDNPQPNSKSTTMYLSPSKYLDVFNSIRRNKDTFFGHIPQDINGMIHFYLSRSFDCVVCNSNIIESRQITQLIQFLDGEMVDGHLCATHNQCDACYRVFTTTRAFVPLQACTITRRNVWTSQVHSPTVVIVCTTCLHRSAYIKITQKDLNAT